MDYKTLYEQQLEENKKLNNDLRLCAEGLIPNDLIQRGIVESCREEVEKWKYWASEVIHWSHSASLDNLQAKKLITDKNQPTIASVRDFGKEIEELKEGLAQKFYKHYDEMDYDKLYIAKKVGPDLNKMIDHLMEENKELKEEVDDQEGRLEDVNHIAEEWERQAEEKDSEIKKLEEQAEKLEDEVAEKEDEIDDLKNEACDYESMRKHRDTLLEESEESFMKIHKLEEENKELKELTDGIMNDKKWITQLNEEITQLNKEKRQTQQFWTCLMDHLGNPDNPDAEYVNEWCESNSISDVDKKALLEAFACE